MAGKVLLGVGGIQFLYVCSLEVPGGRTAELHPLPLALPVVDYHMLGYYDSLTPTCLPSFPL